MTKHKLDFLIRNSTHYQFVFGNLFPKCFARIDEYGVKNKTSFDNQYKIYLSQKNVYEWQQQNDFFPPQVKNENKETPLNLSEVDDVDLKFLEEFKTQSNNAVVEKTVNVVDGTSSEKRKKKKRKWVLCDDKIKKRDEKKKKFEENEKKNGNNKRW